MTENIPHISPSTFAAAPTDVRGGGTMDPISLDMLVSAIADLPDGGANSVLTANKFMNVRSAGASPDEKKKDVPKA